MLGQRTARAADAPARPKWRATALAVLATLAASLAAAAPQSPLPRPAPVSGWFDREYDGAQRRNASLKTLVGRFTETTTSSLLSRPLVARGTLAVERPSRVALRYTEPDARVVIIDGRTLTTTWPSTRSIDVGTAMARVQKQFVNGTAADLRREFTIDDGRTSQLPGTYYVSMTPKRKQILAALTRLDLWVDRESLLLRSMRMTFASGDMKTMTFDDIVPDAALPAGVFTLPTR